MESNKGFMTIAAAPVTQYQARTSKSVLQKMETCKKRPKTKKMLFNVQNTPRQNLNKKLTKIFEGLVGSKHEISKPRRSVESPKSLHFH